MLGDDRVMGEWIDVVFESLQAFLERGHCLLPCLCVAALSVGEPAL